jgi:hypothetical protein
MLRLRPRENVAKRGRLRNTECWQGICLEKAAVILVALKRNDEYALHIKAMRAPDGISGIPEVNGA